MTDPERPPAAASPGDGATGTRTPAERAAICPFVRTLLVSHPELYDPASRTMSLEVLLDFVRRQRQPGDEGSMEKVFSFFARVNHTPFPLWLKNLTRGTDLFSTDFPGSRGDHAGSTDIYRVSDGAFDAAAFDRVVGHSRDGVVMTRRDIAAAIVESNQREANRGSLIDLANSAGEFALLYALIGRQDGTMTIADMRTVFEHNRWPADALRNLARATAAEWRSLTRELTTLIFEIRFGDDDDDHEAEMAEALRHTDRVTEGPPPQGKR